MLQQEDVKSYLMDCDEVSLHRKKCGRFALKLCRNL